MHLDHLWTIVSQWQASRGTTGGRKLYRTVISGLLTVVLGSVVTLTVGSPVLAHQGVAKRMTDPKTAGVPDPSQLPFSIPSIIEKSEHLIQKDPSHPGIYRVEDPAYRVEFSEGGVTFYQQQEGGVAYAPAIRLDLESIRSSDSKSLSLEGASVRVEENRLIYQRDPRVQEVYEAHKGSVEQSWILQRPLTELTGDLILEQRVETNLTAQPNAKGGIDFVDAEGEYVTSYGKVTVIDHSGKRLEIYPVYKDSRMTLTVPDEWLSQAAYPVVVDPLIGANIRMDTLTTTDNYPAIAFDGTNYLIVWQTGTPNATGTGSTAIRGARVSPAGTVLDATPLTIGDNATQDDEFPSVAYDSARSRYIVVWTNWTSATVSNIFRNTVTTAGGLGTSTNVLAGGTRLYVYPTIVCCDVNNEYTVWFGRSGAGATTSSSIRGLFFNATNDSNLNGTTPVTATATVTSPNLTPNTAPQSVPRVYSMSSSKYLMVWDDFGTDTNGNISANLFTVSVTAPPTAPTLTWGTEIAVSNATTGTLVERNPRAAYDGTNVLIVFQKGTATDADIYARLGNPAGASLTFAAAAFTVSAVVGNNQTYPDVAYTAGTCSANPLSRYMVAWQDYRNSTTNPDIYGAPVTTASVVGTAVAFATATTYIKQYPVIAAYSGGCAFMTAWSDTRNTATTSNDIYAQSVGFPNISNLGPNRGATGVTTITINGLNFGIVAAGSRNVAGTNQVLIGATAVPDANISAWTDTAITFLIPSGMTAAAYSVTVTAGSWVSNGVTLTVDVVGTATKLGFTTQPGGGTGATAWAVQPVVAIQDTNGYTVTTATNAVTLAIGTNPGGGTLTCTTNPVTAVAGVATFAGCRIDKAGTAYTLTAAATGLTGVTSSTFNITVGTATQIAFTTQPGGGTGGTAWTTQPVVAVQDAGGNTVTTAVNSVTLAIGTNPGGGTLTCTTNPLAATAGVATFAGCRINLIGTGYTLTAAATGLTGATSSTFNITVGTATQVVFTTQPGGGTGGTAWATQAAVTIRDAGGNTVTTAVNSITLAIGTNPGTGTLTCTTNPLAATAGVATFAGCRIDKIGTGYTLTAAATGLTGATSATFNITVGTAAQVGFTTQPGGGTGGTAWAAQPVVAVQDAGGNTVTTAVNSITLTIGTNPGGGTLTCATNPLSAVAGLATFAGCRINLIGTGYTLAAAAAGLSGATSSTFNVTVGPAAQLAFTTQTAGGTGGTAWAAQPAVTIRDAGGNTVTTAVNSVTLAIGTNPGGGVLTCTTNPLAAGAGVATFAACRIDKTGTGYTLTAAASGLTGTTSTTFDVTVGAAAKLGFTVPPGSGSAGTAWATQPQVAVQDAGGNTVTAAVNSITLAIGTNPGGGVLTCTTNPVTATAGVAAFSGCAIDKGGNGYTLTAAASGLTNGVSATFNIIQITTTTATLPAGGASYQWVSYPVTLTVTGGVAAYSWTIASGTLPSGLTLSTAGSITGAPDTAGTFNFTVRVTDATTPTALTTTQALTITVYGLTTITVTPANPTISPGQTLQFTATGTFSDNSTSSNLSGVTWGSTNVSVATINATGLATGVGPGVVTVSAIR